MKIKVGDLYDLSLGLADLADKDLEIRTSLKVEKNQRNVSEELLSTDKIRQKIIEKYKDKKVKLERGVKIKTEKWDVYNKEVDELMAQDVNVSLQKIKLNELDGIRIKPQSLRFLGTILDKEENAKK